MKPLFKTLAALITAVVFVSLFASAQGGGGELTGIVQDPTGAVIPGATVLVTNPETGVTRQTTTTAAGLYRFRSLPVANYTLRVEAPGFRRMEVRDIRISTGLVVTQDVQLELGAVAETVTVEAGPGALVQTTESQMSAVVDETVWQEMPLEFRNQNEFINLLPGVVPDAFAGSTRGAAVSGARGGTGNFMVEGFDNNDQGQGGRGAIVSGAITAISPEAIEEYRVISHAFSSEFGKGGGFVTDTVLKSGSNEIHGSVFLYNRVQRVAANSFFSNADGIEDRRIRNQFGASLGGPIVADKTFLHGTVEFHRFRETVPDNAIVSTQEFLDFVSSGAFQTFMESDPAGLCMQLVSAPCPGALPSSGSLGPIFQSFLDNPNHIWPQATRNFDNNLDGWWTGIFAGGIALPVPVFGETTIPSQTKFNENRLSFKADHHVGAKDSFHGTILFEDSDQANNINGSDADVGPGFVAPGRSVLAGITYTRTFSPTVINQFRVSYLRHRRDFPNLEGLEGIPSVVTAFDPLGVGFGNTSNLPQFFTDNQFQYKNDLSWVVGKHSFKAGAEYRRTRNGSIFAALQWGLFLPYGIEDLVTDLAFSDEFEQNVLGTGLCEFFFGGPCGSIFFAQAAIDPTANGGIGGRPQQYRGFRANEVAAYIQDDIRVTPRFTINVGLRWEYFGPPHNFRDGVDSNFFFGNGITPISHPSTNPFFPFNSPLHARVASGGFQQRDENIWRKDTNNFAPRLGFAFDVTGEKTLVVRGGGGIFYDRLWNNLFENIRFNPPFHCFCFFGTLVNGIPGGAISSPGVYESPFDNWPAFNVPGIVPSARHMDENLLTAYWQHYYLGVQWRFAPDYVLETNYVSTLGRKLHGLIDINSFNGRNRGGDGRRPLTTLGGDNFRTNAFKSNYHGLQVNVRKRFSYGLQFQSNYTWGHAIDEVSDAFNNRQGLRPTNGFNIRLDRANADFDIRHRFVTSLYYELPVFKTHGILGGWGISSIFTAQTGVPIPIGDSGLDPNADGYFTERPVFIGGGDIDDSITDNQSPADGYFDTSQFATMGELTNPTGEDPNPFTLSDCLAGGTTVAATSNPAATSGFWCDPLLGRNPFTGPGFVNADFSVQKKFLFAERYSVEFQTNFFNIFNTPQFGLPVGDLDSTAFGRSLSTFDPRIIQFALRFDW